MARFGQAGAGAGLIALREEYAVLASTALDARMREAPNATGK